MEAAFFFVSGILLEHHLSGRGRPEPLTGPNFEDRLLVAATTIIPLLLYY